MNKQNNKKKSQAKTFFVRNKWITVWREQLRMGKRIVPDYYFVQRRDVVVIVPILLKKKKVVMLQQWRAVPHRYIYNLPMGLVEKEDTSSRTAALRELKEEIGCVPDTLVNMGWYWRAPAYLTTKVHVFIATCGEFSHSGAKDKMEMVIPKLFTFDRARRHTADLSSLAALFIAEEWIKKGPRP